MSVFTKQGPNLDAADDSEYSHDHRSHQKLRTKSPNKILTQHACKESLIYIINSGKQPKKTELCNCCVFFFPFIFRIFTAKPQEEGKRVFSLFCPAALAIRMTDEQTLLVPRRKPFIRLTRFNFCFWSYNTTSTKHALRSCKLNSLFSKLNDFGFFSSPLLF